MNFNPQRRNLLLKSLAAAGATTLPYLLSACDAHDQGINSNRSMGKAEPPAEATTQVGPIAKASCSSPFANISALQPADANGLRLPQGFSSKIIAIEGQAVANTDYIWPPAPDGAATFPTADGGYVLAVNSEATRRNGGASAIQFNADSEIVDAYRICSGTSRNCAGGATPWNSWLSCEENGNKGYVWECDPYGNSPAQRKPQLGAFNHEAAAVDPIHRHLYLTEDKPNGLLYRFQPSLQDWPANSTRAALQDGILQAFACDNQQDFRQPSGGQWLTISDPELRHSGISTRRQGAKQGATTFNGGEGIWYHQGLIYFATKGDNKIWLFDCQQQTLQQVYDGRGILTGSDNVTISCNGDVLIAEDGGDMQLIVLLPDGRLKPLLQFAGHSRSEVTGPCFNPAGNKLYLSSQRGPSNARSRYRGKGISYEITLPS